MSKYKTVEIVRLDGKRLPVGSVVELSDQDAEDLGDAVVLQPPASGDLQANLQAEESLAQEATGPGLTPQQEARRLLLSGRGADARAVEAEVLIAARGLQVLQVVAITRGEPVSRWRDRAQEFIGSLRPAP